MIGKCVVHRESSCAARGAEPAQGASIRGTLSGGRRAWATWCACASGRSAERCRHRARVCWTEGAKGSGFQTDELLAPEGQKMSCSGHVQSTYMQWTVCVWCPGLCMMRVPACVHMPVSACVHWPVFALSTGLCALHAPACVSCVHLLLCAVCPAPVSDACTCYMCAVCTGMS